MGGGVPEGLIATTCLFSGRRERCARGWCAAERSARARGGGAMQRVRARPRRLAARLEARRQRLLADVGADEAAAAKDDEPRRRVRRGPRAGGGAAAGRAGGAGGGGRCAAGAGVAARGAGHGARQGEREGGVGGRGARRPQLRPRGVRRAAGGGAQSAQGCEHHSADRAGPPGGRGRARGRGEVLRLRTALSLAAWLCWLCWLVCWWREAAEPVVRVMSLRRGAAGC